MDEVKGGTRNDSGPLDRDFGQARRDELLAARIQRESGTIAKAHADLDAGHGIEDSDMEVWLDQLDQDPETPPPLRSRERNSG
jgi:hypothetical protein